MRLLGILAALAALAACGSVPSTPQLGATGGFSTFDPRTGAFHQSTLVAPQSRPPDTLSTLTTKRAVALLPAIYGALELPVSMYDPNLQLIGVNNMPVKMTIAGLRPSMVLDCGTGAYGANADRYQVSVTIYTGVSGDSLGPAVVESRLSGRAVPNGLSSYVQCASTGRAEEIIAARLRAAK